MSRLVGDQCLPSKMLTQAADDGSRQIPDHLRLVLQGPQEVGQHLREVRPLQVVAEEGDGLRLL